MEAPKGTTEKLRPAGIHYRHLSARLLAARDLRDIGLDRKAR
jgi:hypothetical protein